jgi:IS30 family transposase
LTPEDRARLVAARRAGATVRELADQFGIHRTTVTTHLQREGMPTRTGGLGTDDVDEVVHLYQQGWSARKLAKRFGVSDHTIAAELKRSGIQVRTRAQSNRP